MHNSSDIIIIGAGIIGLSIAREIKEKHPELNITILEKENELGKHTSGRNSGVLHAGIYYASDTLKARFCVEGNKEVSNYCLENGISYSKIGKIILPISENDDKQLEILYKRAIDNGVSIEIVDGKELKKLEPAAYSITGKALFSPNTAIIEPKELLKHIARSLQTKGVKILFNHEATSFDHKERKLKTNGSEFSYGHLINAAGLHSDKVAHHFGIGKKYRLLPFKGVYFELKKLSDLKISRLIYPVPDLRVPFLGVHFTPGITGKVYLGPSAIPSLGRENYSGLKGLNIAEMSLTLLYCVQQFILNKNGFRELVRNELPRYFRSSMAKSAQALVPSIKREDIIRSSKVGIRAQLFDVENKELVMDFVVERGEHSTHILNAISPALTCCFPFARYILEKYIDN